MATITPQLQQLADAYGVLTAYNDMRKRRKEVSVESLLAVLTALGADVPCLDDVPRALAAQRLAKLERAIEPVIVAWEGEPAAFELTLPAQQSRGNVRCTVELEDQPRKLTRRFDLERAAMKPSSCRRFVTVRLRLPGELDWGFHPLTIESGGNTYRSLVISAPLRAYRPDPPHGGDWGCFLPLYALRSERNWGAGDFTDLHRLAQWTAEQGGRVVGTLPLLAAFLDEPFEPSPYAPASRLAWNEFYVDVAQVPELAHCPIAAERVQSAAFVDELGRLRMSQSVDYRRIMTLKRQVLEALAQAFFLHKPQQRYAQFEQFLRGHPHMEDYAEFRAAQQRRREPWNRWPRPLREGRLSCGDYDPASKQYHLYAQWIAATQLESLADAAGGGLYLDLPLGIRSDGYDVWRWSSDYACGASAGSPPDAVWTKGQDWCFPPLHPATIRQSGYQHVRDFLNHHLRLARLLRIDHVMQLHRLYWIPQGMPADQGAYVRYQADELYAILTLLSQRCRTTLIGENLGTVPPEVNRAMERHHLQKMYVVQYEIASAEGEQIRRTGSGAALSEIPRGSLASLNTHDMPTFAGWWQGLDIALREELGLLSEQEARGEQDQREAAKSQLTAWLHSQGWSADSLPDDRHVLMAILKFLAASDAGVVLVNLEDLWMETQPQNVPGTGGERPNWCRKAAVALEEFARCGDVHALLDAVAQSRRRS